MLAQRAEGVARMQRSGTLRRVLPAGMAVAGVAGLALAVNPASLAGALGRLNPWVFVAIVPLAATFYALQGIRWHTLLRAVGIRRTVRESLLVNLAGQTVTTVVPLGDLTRALMVTDAGANFGAAAATVAVQELTFTLLLVLLAAPALVTFPGGAAASALVVAGVSTVVVILTVPAVFAAVRRAVAMTPGVRRLTVQVDVLQRGVATLLRQPSVLAGAVLDGMRVVVMVTAFWLLLIGLHVAPSTWGDALVVVAVSYVGGAISLLPGGVGANEATTVGVLMWLGASPGEAGAAALLQRFTLSGLAGIGGLAAMIALRRSSRHASHRSDDQRRPERATTPTIVHNRIARGDVCC